MLRKLAVVCACLTIGGTPLLAKQMIRNIPTVRALAMGDAFTAVSDDYSALYYSHWQPGTDQQGCVSDFPDGNDVIGSASNRGYIRDAE